MSIHNETCGDFVGETAGESGERVFVNGPTRRPGEPFERRDKEQLLSLMSWGLDLKTAAAQVGVHRFTVYRHMKTDEWFAANVRRAREMANVEPMQTLINASRTSWKAALKLLEYRDKQFQRAGAGQSLQAKIKQLEEGIQSLRRELDQDEHAHRAAPTNRLPSFNGKNGARLKNEG